MNELQLLDISFQYYIAVAEHFVSLSDVLEFFDLAIHVVIFFLYLL
jgi:hypothetical protein